MRKPEDVKGAAWIGVGAALQKTGKPSTQSQRICNDSILP
jgi:hypothetical protein